MQKKNKEISKREDEIMKKITSKKNYNEKDVDEVKRKVLTLDDVKFNEDILDKLVKGKKKKKFL